MAMRTDSRDGARTTLVGFHDLLGFGELLSCAGGTLDSAVGELAYQRIFNLRQSINEVEREFPSETMFFHFNDTVTAYLDVDIQIGSSHTDPGGIASFPVSRDECLKVLHFLNGCAALHQRSIAREEEKRIGPAGRTFVVLGSRWNLTRGTAERVFEVPPLQANLSFAEAYLADHAGNKAGFSHRSYYRLYVNDYLWFVLSISRTALTPAEQSRLDSLGLREQTFPMNLRSPDSAPISLDIFHRRRTFFSLMSHHACDIRRTLDEQRAS
jgi:hypothetical protein